MFIYYFFVEIIFVLSKYYKDITKPFINNHVSTVISYHDISDALECSSSYTVIANKGK